MGTNGYRVCVGWMGSDGKDLEGGRGAGARGVSYEAHAAVCAPSFLLCVNGRLKDLFYRVTSTVYTADARFVLSGSDDGNVRIWKARASEKLGVVTTREKAAMEYRDSLRERWKMDSQIGRVARYVFYLMLARSFFRYLLLNNCNIYMDTHV